jgi:chromosome segregation ATPase
LCFYRQAFQDKKVEFDGLQKQATAVNLKFGQIRQRLQAAKTHAEREAPIEDGQGNPLPLKAQLEELNVSTLAEAEAALEDAEQTVNGIQANDSVFRQYEDLEHQSEDVEEQLKQLTMGKDEKLSLIAEKKKVWESALTNHVYKINIKFAKYMEEMGCTGEVRLKKGNTDEEPQEAAAAQEENELANFKDWGIEILVSYRENNKAQILSAQRHSGGERSVATILYLMALQDMMVAPFRCVDEINQGLDERNERLVFKRIVANSTAPPKNPHNPLDHSGQYFLITPKLLPGLVDMENDGVTIQIVYNGKWMIDYWGYCYLRKTCDSASIVHSTLQVRIVLRNRRTGMLKTSCVVRSDLPSTRLILQVKTVRTRFLAETGRVGMYRTEDLTTTADYCGKMFDLDVDHPSVNLNEYEFCTRLQL